MDSSGLSIRMKVQGSKCYFLGEVRRASPNAGAQFAAEPAYSMTSLSEGPLERVMAIPASLKLTISDLQNMQVDCLAIAIHLLHVIDSKKRRGQARRFWKRYTPHGNINRRSKKLPRGGLRRRKSLQRLCSGAGHLKCNFWNIFRPMGRSYRKRNPVTVGNAGWIKAKLSWFSSLERVQRSPSHTHSRRHSAG